ncbi:MAG: hypothetical protein A3H35_20435 [Betaproteobacteria bacterium RIFCSPLOWO2_02_FULL_62_17]|nr:MAG: hypothetical protein A3H35_20435 [Betaproteobacteria bacterium RIFCSPLOWO2_02_FULL_62_17]
MSTFSGTVVDDSRRIIPITADGLNRGCSCRSLNPAQLRRELEKEPSLAGLADEIAQTRPSLFSAMAVFISRVQFEQMAAIVTAVEQVISLPAYRAAAIARAPGIAQRDFGTRGAFTGFDFHLAPAGPRLIEVNTNAGGALLIAALTRAQQACCREMHEAAFEPVTDIAAMEELFLAMFREEWQRQRGSAPLNRVAIVDDDPLTQYLHPEFLLFRRMFARAGIDAVVADGRLLDWHDGRLWHQGQPLDMVYNRLTDFYLADPAHAALRAAFEAGAVVVTPGPRAHALYADKRNLVTLSDDATLAALGVPAAARSILAAGIPRTVCVTPEGAEALWANRRGLFFKPAGGYGGKAAYRGDKLTRRVWQQILAGDYVAQELVPPSERLVDVDGVDTELKLDVRAYVYAGSIQLLAARLYQGQTTNFRTAGGGFAPVFLVRSLIPPLPS